MKIKAKKTFVMGRFSAKAGEIIEIPASKADQLIQAEIAERVKPEKDTGTEPELEKGLEEVAKQEPEKEQEETVEWQQEEAAEPEPKKSTAKKAVKK